MLKRWLCLTAAIVIAIGLFVMPGEALAYQKLQRGDSSPEVLRMQNALKTLGYNLIADGKYGASTEAVIRVFQKTYGLTVDGVAGQATLEKLYSLVGYAPEAAATPASTIPPAATYSKLQYGSTGSAVKSLQQALNILGYGVKEDGIYGEGTRNAVRAFQRSQGLSVDGIAGAATQRRLYELVSSMTAAPTASPAPTAAPAPTATGGETAYMSARVKTSGGGLNMRAYGSSSAQVLAVIPNNTLVAVVSFGTTWTQVYYGGYYGFVMSSFLSMTGVVTAAPTAAPTPQPATATPYSGASSTARVTTGGGGLNLREYGSSSAKVLAVIPNNTVVSLLFYGTPWSMVAYGNKTGFVMTSFLTVISSSTPSPVPTAVPTPEPAFVPTGEAVARVTTSGGGLNLRSGPSQGSGTIITIPNGEYLQINSYGETWCAVFYNGYSGYVMTRYLTIVSSLSTPAPTPVVTPTPAAAPTSTAGYDTTVFTRTLRLGYTGTDVLLLQQRLSNLNYLAAKDISGTYDNATMDAVKLFQKVHGLTVDGLAGANTFTFLFSASAIAYSSDYSGYTTLHIYYQTVDATQTSAVQKMQNRLRELGYTCSVSGIFDEATYMAVLSFQLRNGVNVTGAADAATQSRLYAPSAKGPEAAASVELEEGAGYITAPSADQLKLLHWYDTVKPSLSGGAHLLIYDPTTHISWTLRLMSSGRHADCEPLTLRDSLIMFRAFGKPSWTIHVVYVKLPDGRWTMATMHNRPHLTGSISGNGFDGHLCVHFLRDMAEAQQNDPNYGVNNQNTLRDAWKALTGQTVN
ncbi:MAG: peptidoglycan-binding protein [Clostridia bacterium]|nr:peptidoglycan-binding protein [Clostridia bacterium]